MNSDPLSGLPPLRSVIASHGLAARKPLGQHFLLDMNLTGRIARTAGSLETATVIEIGPGPGGLTRALLGVGAARVVAIEKDRRCIEALAPLVDAAEGRLAVIEADAREIDEPELLARTAPHGPTTERDAVIVANLPYNIATSLIVKWLHQIHAAPDLYRALVLTLQREVAERLCAEPGGKSFGRLTVLTQWLCRASLCFDIDPRAFTPPPKVMSSVVRLVPRPQPLAPCRLAALEAVTRAAFGQRRKMLRASLKALSSAADPEFLLDRAGIAGTMRPESLPVEAFCALARALDEKTGDVKTGDERA